MSPEDVGASDADLFARFILFSNWVRADRTVRPDAFTPHPRPNLSVSKHGEYAEEDLWRVGEEVACARQLTLYGRADVKAFVFVAQRLVTIHAPTGSDPNHFNITGWPDSKPAQKLVAQEIAKLANYIPVPREEKA